MVGGNTRQRRRKTPSARQHQEDQKKRNVHHVFWLAIRGQGHTCASWPSLSSLRFCFFPPSSFEVVSSRLRSSGCVYDRGHSSCHGSAKRGTDLRGLQTQTRKGAQASDDSAVLFSLSLCRQARTSLGAQARASYITHLQAAASERQREIGAEVESSETDEAEAEGDDGE